MEMNGIEKFTKTAQNYMENPTIRKKMWRNEVSRIILQAMEKKNVTKADLARKLGTSPSNVTQILNGHRNLTIDTICDIAMALDMMSSMDFVEKVSSKSVSCVAEITKPYAESLGKNS